MSYNGVTAETDNDICKLWNNYFSDLYTPSNDATFDKSFYDTVRRSALRFRFRNSVFRVLYSIK
jgi:hypothetical protein